MSPPVLSFSTFSVKSQGLQSSNIGLYINFMQVVWSLHVQGLALFPGLKRSKGQVSAICTCTIECHPLHMLSIYLHYLKVILSVGFLS